MKQPVIVPEWLLSHIAKEEPECIDRIRWEIENSNAASFFGLFRYWPSHNLGLYFFRRGIDCYSSKGKHIAKFKLKAWK